MPFSATSMAERRPQGRLSARPGARAYRSGGRGCSPRHLHGGRATSETKGLLMLEELAAAGVDFERFEAMQQDDHGVWLSERYRRGVVQGHRRKCPLGEPDLTAMTPLGPAPRPDCRGFSRRPSGEEVLRRRADPGADPQLPGARRSERQHPPCRERGSPAATSPASGASSPVRRSGPRGRTYVRKGVTATPGHRPWSRPGAGRHGVGGPGAKTAIVTEPTDELAHLWAAWPAPAQFRGTHRPVPSRRVHHLILDGLEHPLADVYAGRSDADPAHRRDDLHPNHGRLPSPRFRPQTPNLDGWGRTSGRVLIGSLSP